MVDAMTALEAPTDHAPAAVVVDLDVSIIVPVMTADGRGAEVATALLAELDRLKKTGEAILVFDGVRGPAYEDASKLAREQPGRVRVISFGQPFGDSVCLASGFEHARGRVIVTAPQYVQVDPRDLGSLLEAIDAGADLVSPWRKPRVGPFVNRLQSSAFNALMRRILHAPFHDLNCYFRAMRREVLSDLTIYGDMYRFLPAIAYRQGFRTAEVPVRHLQEWGGSGLFGLGVYVRRFLDIVGVVFLTHFTLKPLRFFGTLGALFAGLGGFIVTALLVTKIVRPESDLYGRPLFLLGVLLLVLGVQIIGFGLVGEIIIYTNARNLRQYRIERIYE